MAGPGPRQRARENLTGIVSVLVTGTWLAAMFLGYDWWLAFMLFGYIVVVPVVALLFGDAEDVGEWWDDDAATGKESRSSDDETTDEALQTLRDRYARGEITEAQFERKLERLLETETVEDLEERERHLLTETDDR